MLEPTQTATSNLLHLAAILTEQKPARELIRAHALRLEYCASDQNLLINAGRPVRPWRCNSKLCDYCVSRQSYKNRARLRNALNQQRIPTGSNLNFITLTIKNPSLGPTATRALLEATWRKFTKTQTFADLFRGGSKSEEFTVTSNGFHFHLHLLAVTKYIHFNELRRRWTDCYIAAYRDIYNDDPAINTADGRLLIKVLRVTDKENAIAEVTKYVTKTFTLGRLDHKALAQIALIQRWHRSFELFGSFRVDKEQKTILDNKDLFAGSQRHIIPWQQLVIKIGLPRYAELLQSEVERRIDYYRRHVIGESPPALMHI
jgi:hypothetical protein